MLVVLLRPPRYVWPFNSETSAFWQPLGLLCLAAAVRRDLPVTHVEIWDAPAEKCGWRTLQRRLTAERIDVLGVGEETVSAHEALRAARIVKDANPDCLVVAGGTYFAHAIETTLRDGCVDAIVRGEGEQTFVELLRHADDRGAWADIQGLAYRGPTGSPVLTAPRPLIADLDTLPFPAYDLVDMEHYGHGSRNHPGLVSVEHSRGCVDNCSFCILWKHMGRSVDGNGTFRPCYRTKSPERGFEEVQRLHRTFGRRTFGWVDPTFNASPEWSDGWAERMLASDLIDARGRAKTTHTAWLRADCVVRDEKLGVLGKLVRAGLRQVMIGVERDDPAGLAALDKHHNDPAIARQAFAIFREKYPEVYTIGTMIYGLPGDTLSDLRRLMRCEYEYGMDFGFILPLTPLAGTAVGDQAFRGGYVANPDLASYNFHTPVCTTDTLDLRALESIYWRVLLMPGRLRLRRTIRNLFMEPDRRKRQVHRALFKHGAGIAARSLLRRIPGSRNSDPVLHSRRPSWYND